MGDKIDISKRFIEAYERLLKDGVVANKKEFAANVGVSPSMITEISKGRSSVGTSSIQNIVFMYNISAEWLLTGRGEMLKQNESEKVAHHTDNPKEGIPLIPFSAMAGALMGEQTALEYECERYVVPAFSGADFLMQVKGSSMVPTYISGDIVACRRVPMSDLFFQWNKPYVLDTAQGAIIKRIKPGSDKQHVLIVSDNKDYDPFELPYEDIYAVALVIGIIRLE